ncbi:MAG: hypothetical protein IJA45_07355 [Oscillospiraceae bacterium]|nr:hypothetical protein [Oscillospiraceae bacterium]
MKKIMSILLLTVLLMSLCACAPNDGPSAENCEHQYTEKITKAATCEAEGEKTLTCSKCGDTYTEEIKKQAHTYLDADCETAKTCVNCNTVQGKPKGHNYIQGVCTRCKGDQPGYKALMGNTWQTMGKTFIEEELDVIQLRFTEEGCTIYAEVWAPLENLSSEKQEEYLKNPDSLIEYKRHKYYSMGFGDSCSFTYLEEENVATISVVNGSNNGTIIMERKGEGKFSITEVLGVVINDIVTSCITVGSNFEVVE